LRKKKKNFSNCFEKRKFLSLKVGFLKKGWKRGFLKIDEDDSWWVIDGFINELGWFLMVLSSIFL